VKFLDKKPLENLAMYVFPKKSKALTTNYLKNLFEIKNTRLLILMMHLFMENFIEIIIKRNVLDSKKILNDDIRFSFYQKINIIAANKLIDESLYDDLRALNNLRNQYVHNLRFNPTSDDLKKFTILNYILKHKDYKQTKRKLVIYDMISKSHSYLSLENV